MMADKTARRRIGMGISNQCQSPPIIVPPPVTALRAGHFDDMMTMPGTIGSLGASSITIELVEMGISPISGRRSRYALMMVPIMLTAEHHRRRAVIISSPSSPIEVCSGLPRE